MKKRLFVIMILLALLIISGCLKSDNRVDTVTLSTTERETDFLQEDTFSQGTESAETEPVTEDDAVYLYQANMKLYDQQKIAEEILGGNYSSKEEFRYYSSDETASLNFQYGYSVDYRVKDLTDAYRCFFDMIALPFSMQKSLLECQYLAEELPNGKKEDAIQYCDEMIRLIEFPYTTREVYVIDAETATKIGSVWGYKGPAEKLKGNDGEKKWHEDEGVYLILYRNEEFEGKEYQTYLTENIARFVYSPKYGLCGFSASPVVVATGKEETKIVEKEIILDKWMEVCSFNNVDFRLVTPSGIELVYADSGMLRDEKGGRSELRPCWKISFSIQEGKCAEFWNTAHNIPLAFGETDTQGYILVDAITGNPGYMMGISESN